MGLFQRWRYLQGISKHRFHVSDYEARDGLRSRTNKIFSIIPALFGLWLSSTVDDKVVPH
jgi:hypothetical protein